jgi:Raf kinase inhibitor-like YbhB/YbcL family protein
MFLGSAAFADGETIPVRHTCDGENLSPPLVWGGAPEGTCSFVLICDDPDAPGGTWHHWAVYDIPPDRSSLPEAIPSQDRHLGVKQGINDFGLAGYGGPCPPRGHGPHRYRFRILALSVDRLPLPGRSVVTAVEREARKHVIGEAGLTGLYQRL